MSSPDAMEHAQGPLDHVNLVLRFVLELVMLAALAWSGAVIAEGWWLSIAAAVLAPVVAIGLWGLLVAPASRHRLSDPARLVVELALFAGTALALAAAGHAVAAVAFAVVAAANALVLRWRGL
jgi:hypothetical protein